MAASAQNNEQAENCFASSWMYLVGVLAYHLHVFIKQKCCDVITHNPVLHGQIVIQFHLGHRCLQCVRQQQ